MIKHVFFIILYIVLKGIILSQYILIIFIIHCLFSINSNININKKIINLNNVLYVGFILTSISNINLINVAGTIKNTTYDYIVVKNIDLAVQIFVISASFIFIGLELVVGRIFPSLRYDIDDKFNKKLFYAILILSNNYLYNILNLSYLGSIVKILSLSGLLGIIYFARLWIRDNNNTYKQYTIILYIVSTIMALLTAFLRFTIIMPTLVLLIGIIMGTNSLNILFNYRIIPFIIIFIIFSIVFSDLGKYRGTDSNINIINVSLFGINKNDINFSPVTVIGDSKSPSLIQRTSNLAPITLVIKLVENNGFYNGRASAPLLLALIPRFLFPNKPLSQLGSWFALEAGIAYKDENGYVNNSVGMTIPGELYLDFGWIGIIIGCVLIGVFYGHLWNSTEFYTSDSNITGTIFGGYLLLINISGVGADLQIIITLISLYLIFYIIKIILCEFWR